MPSQSLKTSPPLKVVASYAMLEAEALSDKHLRREKAGYEAIIILAKQVAERAALRQRN